MTSRYKNATHDTARKTPARTSPSRPKGTASWDEMDPDLLRAIIREKVHHTVEHPLYRALFGGAKLRPDVGQQARKMLDVWKKRHLSTDGADIQWALRL